MTPLIELKEKVNAPVAGLRLMLVKSRGATFTGAMETLSIVPPNLPLLGDEGPMRRRTSPLPSPMYWKLPPASVG